MRKETLSGLKSALWFLVKLNILAIPLYAVTYLDYSVPQFQEAWAAMLSRSLQSFGYETALDGNMIAVKDGSTVRQVEFSWDSTGWKSLYAMFALTFASGIGTLGQKLRFLAFALLLVMFVNFLRVDTTLLVALNFGFEYFDFVHVFLWGGLMTGFVIATWYLLFFREEQRKG